jgi:NAD(P) transhydrogenase
MDNATYDLVVIGSGPAGQKGAIAAAKLRKKVAVIDRKGMLGGVSLHTGAIPSKTMREAILYMTGFRQRAFYGCDYSLKERISKEDLSDRVRMVQEREMYVVRHQFRRNEGAVIQGGARFLAQTLSASQPKAAKSRSQPKSFSSPAGRVRPVVV